MTNARIVALLATRLAASRSLTERLGTLGVVVGVAATTSALVVLLGLFSALGARADVTHDREPASGGRSGSWMALRSVDVGDAELVQLMLGPRAPGTEMPPGVDRWPAPGEVLASPALRTAADANPYLAELVRGDVVGSIGPGALRDPDELYVVVGAPESAVHSAGGVRATGFGADNGRIVDITPGQLRFLAAVSLAVLGIGAVALVLTVAQLSSSARRRRLAVLQLLGAATPQVRWIVGLHVAGQAALGVVLGMAAGAVASRALAGAGLFDLRWWPGAALPPWWMLVGIGAALVIGSGWFASRTVSDDPWRERRRGADAPLSGLRLVPLVAGVAAVVSVLAAQHRHRHVDIGTPESAVAALAVGVGLSLVGLVLCAPLLVRAVARLPRRGLVSRVAAARADHHARAATRIATALIAVLLASGVAMGATSGIQKQVESGTQGTRFLSIWAMGGPSGSPPDRVIDAAFDLPQVRAVWVERRSGKRERVTSPIQAQARPVVAYELVVDADDVAPTAAQVQRLWPAAPPLLEDRDVAGDRIAAMISAGIMLALIMCVAMLSMALGVALLVLQEQRRDADQALLTMGLPRSRLGAVRAREMLISAVPAPLVAGGVALAAAIGTLHVDHTSFPVPWRSFSLIPIAAVSIPLLLAVIAALTAPRAAEERPRRE